MTNPHQLLKNNSEGMKGSNVETIITNNNPKTKTKTKNQRKKKKKKATEALQKRMMKLPIVCLNLLKHNWTPQKIPTPPTPPFFKILRITGLNNDIFVKPAIFTHVVNKQNRCFDFGALPGQIKDEYNNTSKSCNR